MLVHHNLVLVFFLQSVTISKKLANKKTLLLTDKNYYLQLVDTSDSK